MFLSLLVAFGIFVLGLNLQALVMTWLTERLPRGNPPKHTPKKLANRSQIC